MHPEVKQNYIEKIRLISLELLKTLDQEIEIMLAEHARDGLVRSGATIKKTMDFIAKGNASLYQEILDHLAALKLSFYPQLESDVQNIAKLAQETFKQESLTRLKKSAEITGKPQLYERMLPEVEAVMKTDSANFQNSLNTSVLKLSSSMSPQKMTDSYKKNIFVIMPIENLETEFLWEEVFVPSIESVNCIPRRADKDEKGYSLSELIFQYIEYSPLVIADLTLERPNCYFEVGYALGRGKANKLILCCREDHNPDSPKYRSGSHKIHFDLRQHPLIFWKRNNLEKFKTDLIEKINYRRDLIEKREPVPTEPRATKEPEPAAEELIELEQKLKTARKDYEKWTKRN